MADLTAPIIIVGGGISGLATGYYLQQLGKTVIILEQAAEVGGKLRATVEQGYTIDWAANGLLNNAPDSLALIADLKLNDDFHPAAEVAKTRAIFWDGALQALPLSPPALLKSPLLLPSDKLRGLAELLQRPGAHVGDESVYDFIRRHFGRAVADRFADVLVMGITAGDAKQLSLAALFPRLKKLEEVHGSLLRGMIKAQRGSKTGPRLHGFSGGMQTLVHALRDRLGDCLVTSASVKRIHFDQGYQLTLADGRQFRSQSVVLATPAFVSADLLAPLLPELRDVLRSIPYADVDVLALAYDRIDVPHLLDGFGFLTPRKEDVRSLGVLFSSSIFPDRAPEGKVLLRVIAGGVPDPSFFALSDNKKLTLVRRDLRISLGITAEPELVQHITWPQGIPQYSLGHQERMQDIDNLLKAYPGLYLTGNAYRGVAVNDCIREAKVLASKLAG